MTDDVARRPRNSQSSRQFSMSVNGACMQYMCEDSFVPHVTSRQYRAHIILLIVHSRESLATKRQKIALVINIAVAGKRANVYISNQQPIRNSMNNSAIELLMYAKRMCRTKSYYYSYTDTHRHTDHHKLRHWMCN